MLTRLAGAFCERGVETVVISMMDEGVMGPSIRQSGAKLYTLGMSRGIPSIGSIRKLTCILKQEKPDLLHTWLYHADLLGLIAGRLARTPHIAWNIRCSNMDMSDYSLLSRAMVPLLARLSSVPDSVFVNSKKGQALHQQKGYHPRVWTIIPNGFDLAEFQPLNTSQSNPFESELGIGPNKKLIGIIGRYDPMKDHATFLNAASRVVTEQPESQFILIGNGVDETNFTLRDQIKSLDLEEYVFLLGERRDIQKLLPHLHLLVSSSAYGEGFPNVIGEAMACGLPCVSTDTGDAADIIGNTGLIVPARDAVALGEAITDMLKKPVGEQKELGRLARLRIEQHFSLPAIVGSYIEAYQQIFEKGDTQAY